jgi:hypothetical protein
VTFELGNDEQGEEML